MTTWHYEIGATRWKRHDGKKDVRAHRAPKGGRHTPSAWNTTRSPDSR